MEGFPYNVTVFSTRFSEALADKDLSHGRFAEMMGTSQQSVTRWANGQVLPKWPNVIRIATAFKEDPETWADDWRRSQTAPASTVGPVSRRELDAVRREADRLNRRLAELEARLEQ